jgi:hypothetical protein
MTDTRQHRTLEAASSAETPTLWTDAPAIAASDTEMVNTTKTAKWVRIVGGTVSAVKTGPAGTLATSGATLNTYTSPDWVLVRAGHAVRITYSVVPTAMQWYET